MSISRAPLAPLRFVHGLFAVPRAFGLIARTPRLRALAVAPSIVSALLLGGWIWAAFRYGPLLVERFWPGNLPGWVTNLEWLVQVAASALLTLLGAAIVFFGAQIVADPFLDPLSAGAEAALGVTHPAERFSITGAVGSVFRVLRDVVVDLFFWALCLAAVIAIGFIPLIGAVAAPVLGWLVNAAFAAVEMSAGALSRRGYHGLARWRAMKLDRARLVGLGVAVVLLMLIPLAQLLVLPVAVVAGAIAIVDAEKCGLIPASNAV